VNTPTQLQIIETPRLILRPIRIEDSTAMVDFAFERLDLHRLEVDTDPENHGSLRLMEKLGFKHEGLFRDRWYVYNEWHASVMLALLKNDWKTKSD